MATHSDQRIVILAIQPKFAQLILERSKLIEFRKTPFKDDISHVVLYATNPIKKVVGFFEVNYIVKGRPVELWNRYNSGSCIDVYQFCKYFGSVQMGVAISIGQVYALHEPLSLPSLGFHTKPPQSFYYLSRNIFSRIKERANIEISSLF